MCGVPCFCSVPQVGGDPQGLAEGEDPEALLAAVQDSEAGTILLRRFAQLVG